MSIGLPTRNGETYIEQALESLLGQDYRELEIVVADNASTDRTSTMVRSFMRRDDRVRHERVEELVSASQNFNRAFSLTHGEHFMWAADDDLWDPSYVRRCVAALVANPAAVMASSRLRFIDPDGQVLQARYELYDNPDLSSGSVVDRVRILMRRGGFYQVYGLSRRAALQRTHLFQDIYGPDVVLTLELAMLGPILRIPDALFFYRRYPDRTEEARTNRQGGIPGVSDILLARMTHLQESLSDAVGRSALPGPTKVRLRTEILRAAYLVDTPMRSRTRAEVAIRAASAWRERDGVGLAKYALAWTFDRTEARARAARRSAARSGGRWVARSKRLAAGARRRVLRRRRAP